MVNRFQSGGGTLDKQWNTEKTVIIMLKKKAQQGHNQELDQKETFQRGC